MNIRQKLKYKFIAIIGLAILTTLISYPGVVKPIKPVYNFFNKTKINLGLDLQGGIHLEYKADVSGIDSSKVADAVQAAQDVIERRVNAFGVGEPLVQVARSGSEYRIIVELPGIKNIEDAKNQIKETPFLEFRDEGTADASQAKGGDLGFVKRGNLVPEFDKVLFDSNLQNGQVYPQVVESQYGWHIIKKIDQQGTGDTEQVHAAHILFAKQTASDQVPQTMADQINTQNKTQADEILKRALAGEDFAALANQYSQDPGNQPQQQYIPTGLTGKNLKSAQVVFANQGLSEPQVSLQFDDEGTKMFADLTKKDLGKTIAIYVDGEIVSAPKVQAEIDNGQAVITGNFTTDEANKLAQRLNEGALPVPLTLVSQQSVEATLGAQSLHTSLMAGLIGIIAVIIFMILYYRFLGVIASFALLIYSGIMISIIKLSVFTPWTITLSLSGIAGFVLSIGMAVDANILIFERTKEEIRRGRNIIGALDEGFKRAWTSIRDGNISTIITSFILIVLGTGFVKGFAVTLIIGVLVSMFTAITITRTLLKVLVGEWISNKLWLVGVKKKESEIK